MAVGNLTPLSPTGFISDSSTYFSPYDSVALGPYAIFTGNFGDNGIVVYDYDMEYD